MNTTTEAEIKELVAQGLKFPQVAERLGINVFALRQACSVLGIRSPKRPPKIRPKREVRLNAPPVDAYLAMLKQGLTLREIGAAHGRSPVSVIQALKRKGLPTSARHVLAAESLKESA